MKKKISLSLIFILITGLAFAQTIDQQNSKVDFSISTMGLFGIKGSITGFSGTVNFNTSHLSQSNIAVCIDAETLETGNHKRDEDVKSDNFMDVKQYPEICFESSTIEKTEKGYLAKGKLQLHGITKHVEIPLTFENNMLKGELEINRLDFKIGEDIGGFKAGKTVSVKINCVLSDS